MRGIQAGVLELSHIIRNGRTCEFGCWLHLAFLVFLMHYVNHLNCFYVRNLSHKHTWQASPHFTDSRFSLGTMPVELRAEFDVC